MPTRFEIMTQRPDIKAVLADADMPGSLDWFESARLGWPDFGVLVISGKTGPGPGDLPPRTAFAPSRCVRPLT